MVWKKFLIVRLYTFGEWENIFINKIDIWSLNNVTYFKEEILTYFKEEILTYL